MQSTALRIEHYMIPIVGLNSHSSDRMEGDSNTRAVPGVIGLAGGLIRA